MKFSEWLPALVVVLTALAGTWAYWFQKRFDRKSQLIEIKRKAYREYSNAWAANAEAGDKSTLKELHRCQFDLFIVASDEALLAMGTLNNYINDNPPGSPGRSASRLKILLGESFQSIRKDCFEQSNLTAEQIADLLPMA